MSLVVKIVPDKFIYASRDNRELTLLRELGHQVIVIAKGETHKLTTVNGFIVHQMTTRPLDIDIFKGFRSLVWVNRLLSLIRWTIYVRKLHADCISCHDLTALSIGWMSRWFISKKKKPLLVYDAHEFEIGRNTVKARGKLTNWMIIHTEKFLMKKCAFSIMVNDSIADEVQRIHKLKEHPVVVRNTPLYWNINEDDCRQQRLAFCKALSVPEDTFIAMYHGMVTENRGVEYLIKAAARLEDIIVVILGSGEDEYIQCLKDLAVSLKVADRILFHPAVPNTQLWKYVGAANVGVIVVPIVFKSYYFGLGNKFFENIQSMTPLICNNTPEMANIIKKYDIGLTVEPPGDFDGLIVAIKTMRTDKELYARFKLNIIRAKDDLCWENERDILKEAYNAII